MCSHDGLTILEADDRDIAERVEGSVGRSPCIEINDVVTRTAVNCIVAAVAVDVESIVAGAAEQQIAARAGPNGIVASATIDELMGAVSGMDGIVTGATEYRVQGAGSTIERIVAI